MAYVFVAYKDLYKNSDGTVTPFLPKDYGTLAGKSGDDLTSFNSTFTAIQNAFDAMVTAGDMTITDSELATTYTFSGAVAEDVLLDKKTEAGGDAAATYYQEMVDDESVASVSVLSGWTDRS